MEKRVNIILKESDFEALEKLIDYFREELSIKFTRTEIIRHCIRERMKVLFPSE